MNNIVNIIVCLSIFLTTSLNSVVIAQVTTEEDVTLSEESNVLVSNDNTQATNTATIEDGSIKYTEDAFAPDQDNNY